jgi:YD repeat-containing protein
MNRIIRARRLFAPTLIVGAALACNAHAETYKYDVLNRLTSVTSDDAPAVTTYYCYDAAGNRTYVGTTACAGGGGQQYYAQTRTPLLSGSSTNGNGSTTATTVPSTTSPPIDPTKLPPLPDPSTASAPH